MNTFWNKLNIKKRTQLVWLICTIFLFIIYSNNISKTISLWYENNYLEEKIILSQNAPNDIADLKKKNAKLDDAISKYINNSSNNHEFLLDQISNACKTYKLKLIDFPQEQQEESFEYIINTSSVTVQGDYISILKFIYDLEINKHIAKVSSCNFYLYIDVKTQRKLLNCKLYLQNLTINESYKK